MTGQFFPPKDIPLFAQRSLKSAQKLILMLIFTQKLTDSFSPKAAQRFFRTKPVPKLKNVPHHLRNPKHIFSRFLDGFGLFKTGHVNPNMGSFSLFASGFDSQSLPLTWGTGPRSFRIFCLFLPTAKRLVKINRKSSLVLPKLGS